MTDYQPIADDDINHVIRGLNMALAETRPEFRHERVGQTVRILTRLWSETNPDFGREAWGPISWMLTEHWDQIRQHMADADLD